MDDQLRVRPSSRVMMNLGCAAGNAGAVAKETGVDLPDVLAKVTSTV